MDKCQWEVVEVMHALKKKKKKNPYFLLIKILGLLSLSNFQSCLILNNEHSLGILNEKWPL